MKTLAKTLISSLTPALLLGLSGCSIHVHGKTEGHTGDGSKTAGGEQAQAKPSPKPNKKPEIVVATPKPATELPKPAPVPAPTPNPSGNVDASGAIGGGKVPTGTGGKPVIDTGAVSGGVKPTKPVDTSAVSGGVKPTKPVDTGVVSGGVKPGIDASGVLAGGAVKPTKPVAPIDNTQIVGGGTVKPVTPIDASGLGAGGKVNTRSPESIAAEKVAAEGKSERGDRELESGSVASGEEKKPKPAPVTKDKGSNTKPALQLPKPSIIKEADGSAVAMLPKNGEGKGQLRTPVVVTTVSCSLPVKVLKQGQKFRLNGRGFAEGAKVTVGGISVPVTAAKPTQIDAQLPSELANGGDVAVLQGNIVATCGKLTINASK